MTTRIIAYVLRTTDQERLTEFFMCLGLSFYEEKHGDGPRHFSSKMENLLTENPAVLEIYIRTKKYVDDTLVIQVDSVKDTLQKLKKEGFLYSQVVEGLVDCTEVLVQSPDGRPVLLVEEVIV